MAGAQQGALKLRSGRIWASPGAPRQPAGWEARRVRRVAGEGVGAPRWTKVLLGAQGTKRVS